MSSRSTTPNAPVTPPAKKRRVHFSQSPTKPILSPKATNQCSPVKRPAFTVHRDDSGACSQDDDDLERYEEQDDVGALKGLAFPHKQKSKAGVKRKAVSQSLETEDLRRFVVKAKAVEQNNEVASLQAQVAALKERNTLLEAALPAAKGSGSDIVRLQHVVKDLEAKLRKSWKDNEDLIEKAARASLRSEVVEEKFKETVVQLKRTEKEKSDLSIQLESLSNSSNTHGDSSIFPDVDQLCTECDDWKKLSDTLQKDLKNAREEITSLKENVIRLESEVEYLSTRRADASTDTITMDAAMAQLSEAHDQLSRAMIELEGAEELRTDLLASTAREDQLKVQLDYSLKYQKQLEGENTELRKALEDKLADGKKEYGRNSERIAQLNHRLSELTELTARQCRIEIQSQMNVARLKSEILQLKKSASSSSIQSSASSSTLQSDVLLAKDKAIRELGDTKRQLVAELENEVRKKAHLQERLARFELSQAELEKEHMKCPRRVEIEKRKVAELEKRLRDLTQRPEVEKQEMTRSSAFYIPSTRKVSFKLPEDIDKQEDCAGDWSLVEEQSDKVEWSFEMINRTAQGRRRMR